MNTDALRQMLHRWLEQHYPDVVRPAAGVTLGSEKLLHYYDHMEIALLELRLVDESPEYLSLLRKRRAYLRRMSAAELKKERFRSLSAF